MTVGHYRADLRDLEFNLFEVLGVQDHLGQGPFAAVDEDTVRDVLRGVEELAVGPFAASFTAADRDPPRLVDGEVVLPEPLKASLDAYFDGEWHRLLVPSELGGYGVPPSVAWAATSMLLGANPAALFYTAAAVFASLIAPVVTDEQRQRFVVPMIERRWGASMVLTEPDAGSDVGAARTRAAEAGDGTWHISGVKRFITNGDFDWAENIVHMVLARPEGAAPGAKGLSMFLVPKYWIEADGSLGERNGVDVTALEDKMGLKGSATCELVFGDDTPARGVLVGDVHEGIRQMFRIITYARMLVSTKAIETASTGYRTALTFARERVQGPDLAEARDPEAPKVAIVEHPDVRRMLLEQKAGVEAMRALVLYAASLDDRIALAEAAGESHDGLTARHRLLLPLIKGYCAERSYELLATSLQVLGGSGYMRDYPVEQYIRDAKIDSIYEGTTGIQALDLAFRHIARDGGATLGALLEEIRRFAKDTGDDDVLRAERQLLSGALDDVEVMLATLAGALERSVHEVGLGSTPLLHGLAELVSGWLLLRHAEVAADALADTEPGVGDRAFYEGKIAAARFHAATVLPVIGARRTAVATWDARGIMDLDPEAL